MSEPRPLKPQTEGLTAQTDPPTAPRLGRPSPARPAVWMVAAVVILGLMAVGGWAWFIFNSLTSSPTAVPTPVSQIAPPRPAINSPLTSVTTAPTTRSAVAYGVVTSRVLNLRSEPSTASASLRSLKNGDIVALARRSGGWYQTDDGGWISALYLEVRQTRDEAESYARELKTP